MVPFYSHILTWGVGFWPREFMTVPSSLVLMVPSPSLSNRAKASLNSAVCSSVRWSAITASGLKHIVLQTYNIPAFYEITYHQDISTATLVLCCTFCTGPRLRKLYHKTFIFLCFTPTVSTVWLNGPSCHDCQDMESGNERLYKNLWNCFFKCFYSPTPQSLELF